LLEKPYDNKSRKSANIAATKRRAHRFAHCYDGFLAGGRRILSNMELDPIGHREAMPAERNVVIMGHGFVSARAECGRERQSDLPLERIASDISHLAANRFEALALALPDFDGQ
jgi:hypothetical protein